MANKIINKNTVSWLWKKCGKTKFSIFILILLESLMSIIGVYFAWFFREIIDNAVGHNVIGFWISAAILVGLICFNIFIGALVRFFVERTSSTIENLLKQNLFKSILNKEYSIVTSTHSGEWLNRLTGDTSVVATGITTIIPDLISLVVKLLGAIIMMLNLVPEFVFILLPVGILMFCLSFVFRKRLKSLHKRIQEADGILRVFLTERLSNLLIVKSFVKEQETRGISIEKMKEHKKKRMDRNWFSNLCNIGLSIVFNGAYIISAIYCSLGILNGTLSYGIFVAVLQLVNQIQSPFANLSGYLPKYYAVIASTERLMEIENYPDDLKEKSLNDDEISHLYNENFQSIKINNLSFKYKKTDDLYVLKNFNLEIKKGQFVALTGISGVGKSTLLKILMKIYKQDSGSCVLQMKEKNIEITPSYRRLFAYVPQGNALLAGSIRDVISFNTQISDDKIWNALNLACANSFVEKLPNKLDSILGEKGSGLSEGQMQRIAIARAIASSHPILLFDECTSALDADTEKSVLENLHSLTDKTVIIVTHRKKALEFCDKQVKM